jgi:hypothetical protein
MTVLAEVADRRALMTLSHIAHSSRIAAVKATAQAHLAQVARQHGWSADELDDRTVPDLGLDARGGMELDLGHRTVRAQVTSELEVTLLDDEGRPLRALPRAATDVDAHRAAKKQLAALRNDVSAIRTRQCQRLEAAMITGRSWALCDARAWLFEAPLLAGVVRALLWRSGDRCFRVEDDGSFAGVDDEPIDIRGPVQVAHPLHVDVSAWSEVFADYERIQPFRQLQRRVVHSGRAPRTIGPIPGRKAMGFLEARGWQRQGGGWVSGWRRGAAELAATPGIEIASLQHGEQPIHLEARGVDHLDAVALSELANDLLELSNDHRVAPY